MKYRFYDIVVEKEIDGQEMRLDQDFVLDLPEHDMSSAVERQEYLSIMMDAVVAASGQNICSFSTQEV